MSAGDDLAKLARKATPGPWHPDAPHAYIWGPNGEMIADRPREDGAVLRMRGLGGRLPIEDNMNFIAACDPTTVLALLAELSTLRATVARLEAGRVPEGHVVVSRDALKIIRDFIGEAHSLDYGEDRVLSWCAFIHACIGDWLAASPALPGEGTK